MLVFLLAMNVSTVQARQKTAKQVVETFQSKLLTVMKQGKTLGFQGRYKRLEKAINKSHDLTKITRVVMGREWVKLDTLQQQTLVDVFTQLSIAAYADNFKEFSGESFVFDSEDETARGGMIVHTYLQIPSDDAVKFDYMLKKKGESWLIINIIANGVSDLALKRSEYTTILKSSGFDALITKINAKIETYAK
ncbi:MAG: ABC transporter substrate-binding protein [Methylococcales bacterium]|nr:ABC transporter substrate-binding protein [Methylococcales bacterium]